uniref:Uncharacterized protein n=1 Tax=Oncorhynchus kisutch TaxID=8019 RepID=A0A8C7JG58_ONCKI
RLLPFQSSAGGMPAPCAFLPEVDKCNSALVCFSWSCLVRSGKLWRVADFSHHGVLNLGQEGLLPTHPKMSLLTQFQHLRVLELKYFWVFKGRSPSTLQILTKSLPNLNRGLVLSSLNLPALRELRAKNIARGITLRQTRLRIQSRWRLYQVLREGTTKLQALNNERLLPDWRGQSSRELSSILQQSCYCLQHLDSWLW